MKLEPTVEKIRHNGHLVVSDIIGMQLVHRTYIGYTKIEALRLFKREFCGRSIDKKYAVR